MSDHKFTASASLPTRAGVGLKAQHLADIAQLSPDGEVAWFEVHAENYMGAGGPPHRRLHEIRERFPLSVHGVGLSIGAQSGLNADHLERLKKVVEVYQPGLVSEHLAWSSHDLGYFNDLLPVPYTQEAADRVVAHINQVQDALGRRILLENPSTYVRFESSTMSEVAFIKEVASRSGCGLLLDVNNVYVSAVNHNYDPYEYLDEFPLELVGEIHLGGHAPDEDDQGAPLLIDAHDREVIDPVWKLYDYVLARTGPAPTLIEWDNDVPEWPVLAAEAARANMRIASICGGEHGRAA